MVQDLDKWRHLLPKGWGHRLHIKYLGITKFFPFHKSLSYSFLTGRNGKRNKLVQLFFQNNNNMLSLTLFITSLNTQVNKLRDKVFSQKKYTACPEINPHICSQLIFVKSTKNAQRKDNFFNKNSFFSERKTEYEIEPLSYIIHKNQLKMD